MFSRVLRVVRVAVARSFIFLAALGLTLTWLGRGFWYLEGAAYFVPMYGLLSVLGTLLCVPGRSYRWMAVGVISALAGLATIAPCYWPGAQRAPGGCTANLRILQANLWEHRANTETLIGLIRETRPDVVLLQEVDGEWEDRLRPLESDYPNHAVMPRYVKGGPDVGVYWRVASGEPETLSKQGIPGVALTLHVNGRDVCLVNTHTAAPFSPRRAASHARQMHALGAFSKAQTLPLILAGDLNSGYWSPLCQRFVRETGLASARQGIGILGTWPSFLGPFGCGIDQLFVSKDIQVIQCRVGCWINSDHFPLITELFVPPA